MTNVHRVLLALLPSLALLGCNGDGDQPANAATADVLITDDPVDELSSFHAEVVEVRLRRQDGSFTDNLMGGVLPVEFLSLGDSFRWIASTQVAAGTYEAIEVVFDAFTLEARDLEGELVTVDAAAGEIELPLDEPLELMEGDHARFEVDVDLSESLEGDVPGGSILFDPTGSVSVGNGALPIEPIEAIVRSTSPGAGTFTADAYADNDLDVALGQVSVELGDDPVLLREDGTTFASAAEFFEALRFSEALLEIHGVLSADGTVTASRVAVEDDAGGDGSVGFVQIQGRILDLQPNALFELTVVEVEEGADTALPVLEQLGNPFSITVRIDDTTSVVDEDGTPVAPSALLVGQEVHVRFLQFMTPPFLASRIEIEDANPPLEGEIVAVSPVPGEFIVHLSEFDPAVQSGQVESSTTDVVVSLDGAPVFLNTPGQPQLDPAALLEGMRVRVRGTLEGPPDNPVLFASEVVVRAGRLDGALVTAVNLQDSAFQTLGGEIEQPFGGNVTRGPLVVTLPPEAIVDGDAQDPEQFLELFEMLQTGQQLEVRVDGIGTGTPNEIAGYAIQADVVLN